MKALYNWIEEYAKTGLSPIEMSESLTMLGMEVESMDKVGGKIDHLITGLVKKVVKHPDSDHLSICSVEIPGETLQIICGASNVKENIKVLVALVGCVLSGNFKIKKAKIRGVESYGMICSKEELGLEEKSKGIWILDDNVEIGLSSDKIIGGEDYIYDVAITSNRSDCLSIIGLAREAAAGKSKKITIEEVKIPEDSSIKAPSIEIKDGDLCPRYSSRIIKDVKITQSPQWLSSRLESCGIRSINNIVDATNYILLEYGHPLHAFDLHKLSGEKIVVRRAKDKEKIITLDGEERELAGDMLIIADENTPVAIAGIMGGANSEIGDTTVDLLLESAYFEPISIRRTSNKLGLSSEASYRFARNVDWGDTVNALDKCVKLILETGGGKVSPLTDNYINPKKDKDIELSFEFMRNKLGVSISANDCKKYLENLEFVINECTEEKINVKVPTFRSDVSMNADLVEEICRHFGYNEIPATLFPVRINENVIKAGNDIKDCFRDILCSNGLQEVINYNFIFPEDLDIYSIDKDACVTVLNPMSNDQKFLRTSLMPNLLKNVKTNIGHGIKDLRLFEIGKIFDRVNDDSLIKEELTLGVILTGFIEPAHYSNQKRRMTDFYDLSGVLQFLSDKLNIENTFLVKSTKENYHPGRFAEVFIDNVKIGFIGELHPKLLNNLDISNRVYYLELSMELLDKYRKEQPESNAISRFPSLYRDLAFVLSDEINANDVLKTIKSSTDYLEKVNLVSIYKGEQIDENQKSLAFAMEFVCNERTLEDEEIDSIQSKIIENVAKKHSGVLR